MAESGKDERTNTRRTKGLSHTPPADHVIGAVDPRFKKKPNNTSGVPLKYVGRKGGA